MVRSINFSIVILSLTIGGCTAHYYKNNPIDHIEQSQGYRLGAEQGLAERSDSLLVLLAFSGGGTRAAAYSYGVLEALRDININWEGRERRLIDEIDSISSVSGGSFTAAYYGLFGDRIFDDFESKFLKKDVQGHLTGSIYKPWTWLKIGSRFYGRSEYAADYYDEILFEGKTFGDMVTENGPLIQINATEVSTGTQFTFLQDIFDLLCSDLSTFPISRAVAASSAVPILFSSVTLDNRAGSCGYELPPATIEALNDPDPLSRRRHLIEKYVKYLDSETYPYLHLYDGGLTDNLGIRPGVNRLALANNAWALAKLRKIENVRRILFIVVNAQTEPKMYFSQRAESVPLLDTILGATSIPLNEYTFESLVTLKVALKKFAREFIQGRCAERAESGEDTTDCDDFKEYMVIVDIDSLRDKDKRERLEQLPTSFVLQPAEVDELRAVAKTVLHQSKDFQQFLSELQ